MLVLETVILLTVLLLVVEFFRQKYNYWKKRNIPYLPPRFPLGNMKIQHLQEQPGEFLHKIYKKMKSNGWKHGGIYILTKPIYYVIDLEYVKNIVTKDFEYFTDRGVYYNPEDDPLSAHLLYVGGSQWKSLRNKLNPTFTASKIKNMFPIVTDCTKNLLKNLQNHCDRNEPMDTEKIFSCFTVDNIGSCAFGLECGMLDNEESHFNVCTQNFVETSRFNIFILIISAMFPNLARTLHIRHYPKDITNFFLKLVKDCVKYRQEKNYFRQDFMQMLMDLQQEKLLTIEEIAAQCLIFFMAGFGTSTVAMSFAMYEVAKNQAVQEKARQEINAVMAKHCSEITYEMISDLKFLNQIVDETMRKYPAVLYLTRKCTKNYTIPNENVVIEKGTLVIIPNYAIQHDEEFYPESEKFDPERFNEMNKSSRHNYAHLPFGEGPRICIGKRFGLLTVKMGLFSLLKNFKFTINSKTDDPLKLTITSTIVKPKSKIWLNVHKL